MQPRRDFKEQATPTSAPSDRKPAQSVAASSNNNSGEGPILPPPAESAKSRRRKVIDLATAVSSMARAPMLDRIRRRVYLDWLSGDRPRVLRISYRSGRKPLSVDAVDDVLREQARKKEAA
jgi:hypothetical protein